MTVTEPSRLPGRRALEECVRLASLAPSIHNTQPWRFRINPHSIDVLADWERGLPVIDPDRREMQLSLGAAICNLRIAIAARSTTPVVELLPDTSEPDVMARVSLGRNRAATSHDRLLRAAIPRRHTNRLPFSSRPLDDTVARALELAAILEGASLTVLDFIEARSLLALVRTANVRLRENPAYHEELARWTTDDPGRGDGVPPAAFGPRSTSEALPVRDFGLGRDTKQRDVQSFEVEPTIAVLATKGDTPLDWLRAGIALERVLLEATVAGIATACMSQPLEVPPLRHLYDEGRPQAATQMILRLGYAPPATPTPRRPLHEVVERSEPVRPADRRPV
jgi:nitroreductase